MMRVWPAILVVGVAIVLLGSALVLLHFHVGQLSYSLDFGSILDAGVILLVAAFIEYAYSKRSSDKRADTDLLLEIVKEARTALDGFARESHACDTSKSLTVAQKRSLTFADREFSNAVHSIKQALRHCHARLDKLEFHVLKDLLNDLRE